MKKICIIIFFVALALGLTGCSHICETCEGIGSVACTYCTDGTVICEDCEGNGYYKCKKCNGNGKTETDEDCPSCKDSNKKGYRFESAQALKDFLRGIDRDESEYWKKCYACEGTGHKLTECTDCNGSGQGPVCEQCSGTGKVNCPACGGSETVTCSICNGKGKVK